MEKMGVITLVIMFFLSGIFIDLILAILVFYFIRKYRKTNKFSYLYLTAIIFLILGYFSFNVLSPIKGRVVDSIDGKPVENVEVIRVVETKYFVMMPDGNFYSPRWHDKAKTNKEGYYSFPMSVHLMFPFSLVVGRVYINSPICATDFIPYEFTSKNITDCNPALAGKYYSEVFISHGKELIRIGLAGTESDEMWTGHRIRTTTNNEGRSSILPVTRNIYLLPRVNKIGDCEKATTNEFMNACKGLNVARVAILDKNTELCENVEAKFSGSYSNVENKNNCITDVAASSKDEKVCEKINKGDDLGNTAEYFKNKCLRRVAAEKKDSQLCNSVPKSEWNDVYGCLDCNQPMNCKGEKQ